MNKRKETSYQINSSHMEKINRLIEAAKEEFGEIVPCGGKAWDQCLTRHGELNLFWFNTADGSTHVMLA